MESIKLIITHNVDAQLSYRTGVGSNLTRPQCLSMYISMGDAMLGRSDTKLGVLGVSDAQLSYRTGVGSNLTRPQCLSMYISMGDAMLGRSDTKLGVLGVSITTHNIV